MTSSDILCELKEHNSSKKRNFLRELCFFGSLHRVIVSLLARNLFLPIAVTRKIYLVLSPLNWKREILQR